MVFKNIVLDASALFNPASARSQGENFYTIHAAINEIKDPQQRETFERERLLFGNGAGLIVREPSREAVDKVIACARKTGDLAVLSSTDIRLLALTYDLHLLEEKKSKEIQENTKNNNEVKLEEEDKDKEDVKQEEKGNTEEAEEENEEEEEEEEDDDGEGEWITPGNIEKFSNPSSRRHKSNDNKNNAPQNWFSACFTRDFAMQNVGLQMSLNILGVDGKRITQVKTWVLRCHACFKIVKPSPSPTYIPPKFCPSCGNGGTLLRCSVTYVPVSKKHPNGIILHLRKNFQYRNRGTQFSIPNPKKASAKAASDQIILREDQKEWARATSRAQRLILREEEKKNRDIANNAVDHQHSNNNPFSSRDSEWVPDMILSEKQRKKHTAGRRLDMSEILADLPSVGHGKKNPNERRRRR